MRSQSVFLLTWICLVTLVGSSVQAQPPQSVIDAAKKEGKVVYWGSGNSSEVRELAKRFKKHYPFLEVEHWRSSPDVSRERIWSDYHSRRNSWDVLRGGTGAGVLDDWIKAGILAKLTVPNLSRLHKLAKDPNGYWGVPAASVIIPGAYNTNFISPKDAPKSWEDFTDPKWKKKVAITIKTDNYMALAQPDGWGREKLKAHIKKLAANGPHLLKGRTQMLSLLAAGEFPLATGNVSLHDVVQLKEKGAPLESVMTGPVVFTGATITMNSRAPHPNAAYLWVDWLFSAEAAKAYDEIWFQGDPFPNSGTRQAEMIKGIPFIVSDENFLIKNNDLQAELYKTLGIR